MEFQFFNTILISESENMGIFSQDEDAKLHILNNFDNTLDLLRDGGCNDVTIICRNGKFTSNTFLLAAIFKVIRNIFQDMQFLDENMMLTIPDMDLIEFELFFENIHQGKKSFNVSEGIFYLLHGRCHSLQEEPVSLKHIGDKECEKVIKDENVMDDFDNVDHFVDVFDPLDEGDDDDEALINQLSCEVDVKDIKGEEVKEEYRENGEDNGNTLGHGVDESGKVKVKNQIVQCHGQCGDSSCRRIFSNKEERKRKYSLQVHIRAQVGKKRVERKQRDGRMPCHGKCGDESCRKVYRNNWEKQRHIDAKTYIPKACHICGIIPKGKSKDSLIKHLEEHEGGWKGKSRCKICLKSFPTEEIEEHQNQCQPGVVCPICGKLVKTQSQLSKHVESVHAKLKLEDFKACHICGKNYKSAENLEAHIKKIHAEKVACPQCGILVRNLKTHIAAIHTLDQDKKFQCQDCGKGFDKTEKLEKHRMNVHLKLQPYKCRYGCDIAYNDSSNRNHHEKKKHGKLFTTVKEEKLKEMMM